MSLPAPIRPGGRLLTTRDAALVSPTVLCAEPRSVASVAVAALVDQRGWDVRSFDDPSRAVHHVSARDTRLVVVAADAARWALLATRTLRIASLAPVAVVGGPFAADDALALLDAGANILIDDLDDQRHAIARLTAVGRGSLADEAMQVRWLHAGELRIDLSARRCFLAEERIALSQNEFDLLAYLMSHAQQTVGIDDIVRDVWNWRHGDGANVVRIAVGRLRRKLHDTSRQPRWIASVRGVGYQFMEDVSEIGEDRGEDRLRRAVATLHAQADAMNELVDALRATADVDEIAEHVVQWAVDRNFADAATVFRVADDPAGRPRSELVASAGMSSRWRQALATGHPLHEGFVGAHAYESGEPVQVSDMTRLAKRFPVTARMSTAEDLHACLLFPLLPDGRAWGDLAFLSRESRAFNPARTAYLRTAAGVVSLALAARTGGPRA